MTGFQNLSGWAKRDPYREGNYQRPSMQSLQRLQQLRGVSPDEVPFGEDEMGVALGQQVQERDRRLHEYATGPRFDPMKGGWQQSPTMERIMGDAISGGNWGGFSDQLQRSELMAKNRGFRSNIDLIGKGPGSGTGVGRYMAQLGTANSAGSFTPTNGPATDLDTLLSDANNSALKPQDRQSAMRALTLLTRGR
jgi:hypothetical protein